MNFEQTLRQTYLQHHPAEAAQSIEAMHDAELRNYLDGIDAAVLVLAMDRLTSSRALTVFEALGQAQQQAVIAKAPQRLALNLLDALDDPERKTLLDALPIALRRELERLEAYAEGSAGRLLERSYDTIYSDMTVATVLDVLRRSGANRLRSVYVVDRSNRLAGRVDMQAIAMADSSTPIAELLEEPQGSVLATAPRKEVVELLDSLRVDSIPVVDVEGRLLGVVRHQSLFDAIESVATAAIQRMVGASADERALSHIGFSVRRRLPWLHINLLTAFLAAAVVGMFETLIAQFTALAVLLPVVAGQSGNAGSQALAVTMRGLALREIGTREWRKVLWKEIGVGAIDGLALAVTCGVAVFMWSRSLGLSLVIAVAMVLSMVAAGISGAIVPIFLTHVGQDPTTASSIILTTVTDVAGFISFLGTATLLSFML